MNVDVLSFHKLFVKKTKINLEYVYFYQSLYPNANEKIKRCKMFYEEGWQHSC